MAANAGYHLATWIVTFAIGLGFGWIATGFPAYLQVIKYGGSLYVLYLAWCLARAGTIDHDTEAKHAGFLDGVILLLLNPKAYLIIALMFSQFSGAGAEPQLTLVLWIATLFTLNNLVAFSLWAFVGDRLAMAFRHETRARQLNLFFAAVLAGVAIWMLFG